MINEKNYFHAMDRAVVSLGFNPYDMDGNDYTSFFWGLITEAYMALVQPVVSHLPRGAALCVEKALEAWADGIIEREENITARARKKYEKWFKDEFMSLWHKSAIKSRLMLSCALEEYVSKFLNGEGLPGVHLELFAMQDVVKSMERHLHEKALPFMLHEISSYKFVELDNRAADRAGILRESHEALKAERESRVGLERNVISETLVTEELIFSFACAVIHELNGKLTVLKRGSVSGGN